jgi:hypothetical protein
VTTASYWDTEKNEIVYKKWRKEDKWTDYHLLVIGASWVHGEEGLHDA